MKRNLKGRYVIALASLIMLGTSVVTLSGCSNTQNVTSTAKVVVTGGKNGFVMGKSLRKHRRDRECIPEQRNGFVQP